MSNRIPFRHSIFVRIYASLLLVCIGVALFAQLLISIINDERANHYRHEIATGVFTIVSGSISHYLDEQSRETWLFNASKLFGSEFTVVDINSFDFTAPELNRLEKNLSVVRYVDKEEFARVFHKIPNENNAITVKITQLTERQVRTVGTLLQDDLSFYLSFTEQKQRLAEIAAKSPYPVELKRLSDINIDEEQFVRLNHDKTITVFYDSTSSESSAFSIITRAPMRDLIIEVGPVTLFNWYPFNLIVSVVLISTLLISLGLYALIFPLERKLQLVQSGLNDISKGNLDTRVQIAGQDELARLSATFNAMAEHIKRLIEAQRELTRAVSHELRTPVARIRFAVDMLADTDEQDSREMQRDYIDEDIEALNGLIDEILTYAKLEEGSPKLDWTMVDIKDVIQQIVRETNALGKSIAISAQVPATKIVAEADRRYLHRVLQNLAGNALRYAKSEIIISTWLKKGLVYISVEDDGEGIPEADREKVFIPFARLDDSRTRASGGYGLGLSIVSRITFWFNGHMQVDASPKLGGARFMMRWPIKQLTKTIEADAIVQIASEQKHMEAHREEGTN